MRTVAVGTAAGALAGALVLVLGVTAAAWTAIALAVLATVGGAVDYVRTHG